MRNYLIVAIVAAISGAAITKYYWPTNKITEVAVTHTDIVTQVREVVRPDGTKEITTITTDKTVKKDTNTVVAVSSKPKYQASISATRPVEYLTGGPIIYGVQIDYNILGPITLGVRADTSKQVGLVVGVAF
jgi:hypothetical protein